LRRSLAHFKLCAYFLQTSSKRFNLLLLARDRRFLLCSIGFYLGYYRF
jgi:hypothetical protein